MPISLMKIGQVCKVTGYGKTTIYKWIKMGDFPRPVTIGRTVRWPSNEIDTWIDRKIKEGR